MSVLVSQLPLDHYEALDVIGNGSFGIIRKVRRKSDSVVGIQRCIACRVLTEYSRKVLARKELNFERMSERDKKQIVAEV